MPTETQELFLSIGPGDGIAWKFIDRGRILAHSKESARETQYRYVAPEMEPFEAQIKSLAKELQFLGNDPTIEYYWHVSRKGARAMGLCRASTNRKFLVEYYWSDEGGEPMIELSLATRRVTETVAELEDMRMTMIALMGSIERTLNETSNHRETGTNEVPEG